jgi:hypothetical protein
MAELSAAGNVDRDKSGIMLMCPFPRLLCTIFPLIFAQISPLQHCSNRLLHIILIDLICSHIICATENLPGEKS